MNTKSTKSKQRIDQNRRLLVASVNQLPPSDQNVIMYASRLFENQTSLKGIEDRTYCITIKARDVKKPDSFKKQVYKRLKWSFHSCCIDIDRYPISVLIAGDVEATRDHKAKESTFSNPLEPHYHMILVIPEEIFSQVSFCLDDIKQLFAKHLSMMEDTLISYESIKAGTQDRYLWWELHERRQYRFNKSRQYSFPLGNIISYSIKADRKANNFSIGHYQPSVFPFELKICERKVKRANKIFEKIAMRHLESR